MDFSEIVHKRQSCRSYDSARDVEPEKVTAILEAARLAPSACNGQPYVKSAAMGAKLKNNDYRSIDIGIATAYLTARATELDLSTCILGWLDDAKIRELCDLDQPVRLVITLGYAKEDDKLRQKKRKELSELVSEK